MEGSAPGNGARAALLTLHEIQWQFPQFAIWRETTAGRIRYVARRARPGTHPHTVVTGDLTEMQDMLTQSTGLPWPEPGGRPAPGMPSVARIYDYWCGGKDHMAADRRAAGPVMAEFPEVAGIARANRAFVAHAVTYAAARGVAQFLDIGSGLPAWPAVHQLAQGVVPAARTVYLDHDPIVLAHSRALLADGRSTAVAGGDLRNPKAILTDPTVRAVIRFEEPVCLLLAAVLDFLEPEEAGRAVATLTAPLAPGSYLVISAGTATGTDPALLTRLRFAYAGTTTVTSYPEQAIREWFTGFGLVPPGLVDVRDWQATSPIPGLPRRRAVRFLAAIGHKHPPTI